MSAAAPVVPADPFIPPVLAEVVRSGFVEGRHRGSLVLLAADASVELALGQATAPVFPALVSSSTAGGVLRGRGLTWQAKKFAGLLPPATPGWPSHRDLVHKMLAEHG